MSHYFTFAKIGLIRTSRPSLSFILVMAFASTLFAQQAPQATIAWNAGSGAIAGYDLYYGLSTGNYTTTVDVGNTTTTTLQNLSSPTYYIAVAAYDSNNDHSGFSPELIIDLLTASAGAGGTIAPSGSFFQTQGASQTFTITPSAGYQIAAVQVDGASAGAVTSYTLSNIMASHTISATFSAQTTQYTIMASAGPNGSISPSTTVTVNFGASQTFTIIPAAGYQVAGVQVDGSPVGAVSSYKFTTVTANHTIAAAFAPISIYTISASVQGSGSISPSGTVSIASGKNLTFTITPAANQKISGVTVNGKSVGAVSSFTFTDVAANHTIAAAFASNKRRAAATVRISGSISPSPVADAGPDQAVKSGSIVTLNGSNSTDSVSGIASYKWTQASGPSVKLSKPSAPICTLKAPDIAGGKTLAFNLEVTNKEGVTGNASCLVNVSGTGQAPLANAGPDQTVQTYTNVTLNGSGSSDQDAGIVSYSWVQISGPYVAITNADTAHASFAAPDAGPLGASLVFQLQVADPIGLTTRDRCTINVIDTEPPPVANAGPNQTVAAMQSVALDGSGSYDPVNSTDSYRWKQISGAPVTLSDPTAKTPVFIAPALSGHQSADLVFMLTVTDTYDQLRSTAKCAVTVKPH